jgi:adenylate cyclase
MGIALNTGTVIAGNIGSERRSKYGFVGHAMNVTSRIEDVSATRRDPAGRLHARGPAPGAIDLGAAATRSTRPGIDERLTVFPLLGSSP